MRDGVQQTSSNPEFVQQVTEQNVRLNIERIRRDSPILREMEVYDMDNGGSVFLPPLDV